MAAAALLLAGCQAAPTAQHAGIQDSQLPQAAARSMPSTPPASGGAPFPPQKPSVARGEAVFSTECAGCHSKNGVVDLADPDLVWGQSPAQFFVAVRKDVPGSAMPAFGEALDERQMWDVVAYVRSLMAVPEQVALGQQIYDQQCTGCHGAAGDGSGQAGAARFTDAAWMAAQTHQALSDAITQGVPGTPMPAFGDSLSQDEIWMVVNYVWTFAWDREGR